MPESTGSSDTESRGEPVDLRQGDALSGQADPTRPSNPWPRLLALGGVILAAAVLVGVCVNSFASPPAREIEADRTAFDPGVPRFFPVTTMGADRQGNTYGAWVMLDRGGAAVALFSRSAATGCHIRWDGSAQVGGTVGVFIDPCGAGRFSATGEVLNGTAGKDMESFAARIEGQRVIAVVARVILGTCRTTTTVACSPVGGAPLERAVPSGTVPADFATR